MTECKFASNSLCLIKICTDLEYVLLQEDVYNLSRVGEKLC